MADQTSARAVIRIGALPDSSLRRSLTGTVDASRKASADVAKAQAKAAKDAERDVKAAEKAKQKETAASAKAAQKAADATAKAAKRAEEQKRKEAAATEAWKVKVAIKSAEIEQKLRDADVKAQQKADSQKARSAEQLEKYKLRMQINSAAMQSREQEKSARGQIRDAQKAQRQMQAVQRTRKDALMRGGALLAGAGAAAYGRVDAYASTFGAQSTEQLASQAVQFQRRSALLADMGGQNADERKAMQAKILATSARTGVGALDLLGGLEAAQDRFSGLKEFTAILDNLADVSVATNTSVESVVGAFGVMRRQFDLTDEQMVQLGGAMVQAADLGNISFQDVADNFAAALGAMGRNANLKGIEGAKQALGITQLLGTSDMSASEAATLGVRTVSTLNDVKVQKLLAKSRAEGGFGVNVTKDGKLGTELRPMAEILSELALKGVMDPSYGARRQNIFKEERGQRGIEVLVDAFNKNPMAADALLSLDPKVGGEAIKRRLAAMNEGTAGKAATLGARQFETFMNGKGMQQLLDVAVKSADSLAILEAQYPLATEALGITTGALKGFGAMLIAQTLFGRRGIGGGALPGGMGSGGDVSAGAAWGGSSFIGKLGVATTAIGVFAAAFETTTGILRAFNISEKDQMGWGVALHGDSDRAAPNLTGREKKFLARDKRDHMTHAKRVRSALLYDEDAVAQNKAAQARELAASLHIEVSDTRVRVSKVRSEPGFDLTTVDNGNQSVP